MKPIATKPIVSRIFGGAVVALALAATGVHAQPAFTKAQVGERIRRVEDGVDEFRKYLERRGDDARNRKDTAEKSVKSTKRGGDKADTSNTQARTDHAKNTKDELDDALGELNQSTNRLRRKFDPAPNYLETRVEVDRVMDDARRVNQVMTRGKYGTEPERLWGALRTSINELGRTYGIAPMSR